MLHDDACLRLRIRQFMYYARLGLDAHNIKWFTIERRGSKPIKMAIFRQITLHHTIAFLENLQLRLL